MKLLTFVVPAAGEGKRMQSAFPGVPKALIPLSGRTMIDHVLDAIADTKLDFSAVVVVSPGVDKRLRESLSGREVTFAVQNTPIGTGDAVRSARAVVGKSVKTVAVVFADQPLLSSDSLVRLVAEHHRTNAAVTMAVLQLKDFLDWRSVFYDWGRIIRDGSNSIVDIVEIRNATSPQLALTEVNPSLYCFTAPWIWDALDNLSPDNTQGEYLLTDVISIAVKKGLRIQSINILDPREVMGANTPEQMKTLESVYQQMGDGRKDRELRCD